MLVCLNKEVMNVDFQEQLNKAYKSFLKISQTKEEDVPVPKEIKECPITAKEIMNNKKSAN